MKTPHTSCRRGTRIRVRLKTGEVFIDKFLDRTGKFIIFEERGRVAAGDVKSFTPYKPGGACRKDQKSNVAPISSEARSSESA